MDDLSGLDWNTKPSSRPNGTQYVGQLPIRPTPSPSQSGRSTPLSSQLSGSRPPPSQPTAKASTNNSFSNLLAPQPTKPAGSLSLQDRQRQLQAQKGPGLATSKDPYSIGDTQFWEGLGSGRGTPAPGEQGQRATASTNEDDLLAAFSSAAPVDKASYMPTPVRSPEPAQPRQPPVSLYQGARVASNVASPAAQSPQSGFVDDDDPFGLGQMGATKPPPAPQQSSADDDILGDLGKPVSEVSAQKQAASKATQPKGSPADKALAELVDMGFPPERARYALDQTDSGRDVQAAVGVLLNEAHSASNSKAGTRPSQPRRTSSARNEAQRRPGSQRDGAEPPPWLNGTTRSASRPGSKPPGGQDREPAQQAQEIGASIWKSANSLWKTGQKRMAKAVAEFQQEGDPNQPKWMRDGQPEPTSPESEKRPARRAADKATDEAAVLDAPRQMPPPRQPRRQSSSRTQSSPASRPAPSQPPPQQATSRAPSRPSSSRPEPAPKPVQRLNRQAVEEQTAQAYVSPARRRKQQPPPSEPKPQPPADPADALDIFSAEPITQPAVSAKAPPPRSATSSAPPRTVTPRPKAPPRNAPSVPQSTLDTSHRHRKAGTEAFKRGDYVAAHASYTSALNGLPSSHPVIIIVRSNRAITSLKSGDAKAAMADADAALEVIGLSNGEGESIALGGDEGDKSMKEFYGKALMRKAEALEHMEKYPDAAKVWRDAVQAGVGGAVAIQGRNRCEKAAGGGSQAQTNGTSARPAASRPKPAPKPRPKPSAAAELSGTAAGDGEAVRRLRAAEAAAAKASDEAFALSDAVEARITSWKGGKADNLRALLASLDTILWADAGWNKVGMGDLVLPNRVKIIYMKAIAKVHPDKIPQNASTEQKMISATVFAALNEAWDKFKKDNGL